MATLFQFPYRTVAEVSLRALVKNLVTLRSTSKREIIPVIKADAYGHGMIPVAKALVSRASVNMLAVATFEEAVELRKKVPASVSILVLSGFLPHHWEAYLRHHLIPVIHNMNHLKSLLGRSRLPDIHLKIDTGMRRLGILPHELEEAIRVLAKLGIKLAGLMTHFADSDATTSPFIDEQIATFEKVHERLKEAKCLATDVKIHVSNSGGIFRDKLSISNAVRPGISLYGISPNPRWESADDLVPILQWRARVLCMKDAARNDTIGYGRTYKAKRKEKIAIVPIGYADGFPRSLSNKGQVLINGKRAPIRGRVSMDMIAVDCTHISSVREGTEVTLIGQDGKDRISVWDLADWTETIPYEILCGISPRVPRVYLD